MFEPWIASDRRFVSLMAVVARMNREVRKHEAFCRKGDSVSQRYFDPLVLNTKICNENTNFFFPNKKFDQHIFTKIRLKNVLLVYRVASLIRIIVGPHSVPESFARRSNLKKKMGGVYW